MSEPAAEHNVANLPAVDPRRAAEGRIRSVLADRALNAAPYTRLRIAVAIVQELHAARPLGPDESVLLCALASRAQCSVSQARRGLAALRSAGCLLDEKGRTVLSPSLPVWDLVAHDPLELDARVVRAQYQAVQPLGDDAAAAAAFRAVAGRDPDPVPVRRSAEREPAAIARTSADFSAVREISGSLVSAGLDPVTGLRLPILEALVRTAEDQALAGTAEELAVGANPGTPVDAAIAVMRALLEAGAVVAADGGRASRLTDQVLAVEGDADELEKACRSVYRRRVDAALPGLLDTQAGEDAFARVLSEPRVLASGAIVACLRERGLDPEPQVRGAIVSQLARVVADDAPIAPADVVERVGAALGVYRQQVRHVVNAMRAGDLLISAGADETANITGLRFLHPLRLDAAVVDVYVSAVLEAFPHARADARAPQRIRRVVNAGSTSAAHASQDEVTTVVRELRAIVDREQRLVLLRCAQEALEEVPAGGLAPGDFRRELMRRGGYSSNVANAHLLSLARARLLLAADGEHPTFVGSQNRYVALATDDLVEADRRVVAYYVEQVVDRVPAAEPAEVRERFV